MRVPAVFADILNTKVPFGAARTCALRLSWGAIFALGLMGGAIGQGLATDATSVTELPPIPKFGPYVYEAKPEGEAFEKINPRKAPPTPEAPLLRKGDRLAIIGDSITEQKKYSRLIELYLTACMPELDVEIRQLGWSGETAERFLKRMDQDCLRFDPDVATLCYGMNDARYRPFDFNNGRWFTDNYSAVVDRLKQHGSRVVVGSPGCAGKIAKWVKSKSGTLDEHNQNLCVLRDIAMEISFDKQVGFADVFWPMYQAQVEFAAKYGQEEKPYRVAGQDGIHPGWAGHTLMAYAFLKSLGLQGELAQFTVDLRSQKASVSEGHKVLESNSNRWLIQSERYPFCASGAIDDENSIRSGMTLVPFNKNLNRWMLRVRGLDAPQATVRWGNAEQTFSAKQLTEGVNLADVFVENPFSDSFEAVSTAIAAKQAFETKQIKSIFHGSRGKADIEKAADETEAERTKLLRKIDQAMKPVTFELEIIPVEA